MTMTNEEKYKTLMLEIGELLRTKNNGIAIKTWQLEQANKGIETLREENDKLRKAYDEKVNELATVNEMLKETEKENALLEDALKEAEFELKKYKGGAVYVD